VGIRIVFALGIILGCTLFGKTMSGTLRRRVSVLNDLIRGVNLLRIHMCERLTCVQDALRSSGCQSFVCVGRKMESGFSAGEAWDLSKKVLLSRGGVLDSLSVDNLEVMNSLFDKMGEMNRQEQDVSLRSTLDQLKKQYESARVQLSERERLYISVGFLTGLMIALSVI